MVAACVKDVGGGVAHDYKGGGVALAVVGLDGYGCTTLVVATWGI